MSSRAVFYVALSFASLYLLVMPVSAGTGCQKDMTKVCPDWKTMGNASCVACVLAHWDKLKADCTLDKCKKKCATGPPPFPVFPPAPPSPPLTPIAGALRPHIVLFVVDDQGWANVGYHNKLVKTPNMDSLAESGIKLERHYAYRWCAPSRASLMTGRLPYHVREKTNYVTPGMTMLPRKLQQVGYNTHQVGKWHLGDTMTWMTPFSRGYNTSLGYLSGGEDHYTQLQHNGEPGCNGIDLWDTTAPGYGQNGTYGAFIYREHIKKVIANYQPSKEHPLFMYVALQTMHAPQEVPDRFSKLYSEHFIDFAIMNGMASAADEVLGNLTEALKAKGIYGNTLIIHISDNGGPAGKASSGHSGNNFPLRGGKTNNFEGGIRVAAYMSGGAVPRKGISLDGYIHNADWYPTLCKLAGVDPTDKNPSDPTIPAVDGYDLWAYLNGTTTTSPRTEIMISAEDDLGAIISGDYKLIFGEQSYGFWTSLDYPNSTTDHNKEKSVKCTPGCLFNIQKDPSEYNDLIKTMPDKFNSMLALWKKRNATRFMPQNVPLNTAECQEHVRTHKGFLGPYLKMPNKTKH